MNNPLSPELISKIQRFFAPEALDPDSELYQLGIFVRGALATLDTEINFFETEELTEAMIQVTQESYERNADFYAMRHEINPEAIQRIMDDYLKNFIRQIRPGGNIAVLGSGYGRDATQIALQGFTVNAVDSSVRMAQATQATGNGMVNTTCIDMRKINFWIGNNYDGILVDSALEHLNKDEVYTMMDKFFHWLRPDGTLLVRLKLTDTGKIYEIKDGVGTRYFTSWTLEEIEKLLLRFHDKFRILEKKVVEHMDPTRPPFYSIMGMATKSGVRGIRRITNGLENHSEGKSSNDGGSDGQKMVSSR